MARDARAARHARARGAGDRRAGAAVRLPRRADRAPALRPPGRGRAAVCGVRRRARSRAPRAAASDDRSTRAAPTGRAARSSASWARTPIWTSLDTPCARALAQLPAGEAIAEVRARAARRAARRHRSACTPPRARDRAARRVGARRSTGQRRCSGANSLAGAACSVLALHALIAAAADPRTTPAEAQGSRRPTCHRRDGHPARRPRRPRARCGARASPATPASTRTRRARPGAGARPRAKPRAARASCATAPTTR